MEGRRQLRPRPEQGSNIGDNKNATVSEKILAKEPSESELYRHLLGTNYTHKVISTDEANKIMFEIYAKLLMTEADQRNVKFYPGFEEMKKAIEDSISKYSQRLVFREDQDYVNNGKCLQVVSGKEQIIPKGSILLEVGALLNTGKPVGPIGELPQLIIPRFTGAVLYLDFRTYSNKARFVSFHPSKYNSNFVVVLDASGPRVFIRAIKDLKTGEKVILPFHNKYIIQKNAQEIANKSNKMVQPTAFLLSSPFQSSSSGKAATTGTMIRFSPLQSSSQVLNDKNVVCTNNELADASQINEDVEFDANTPPTFTELCIFPERKLPDCIVPNPISDTLGFKYVYSCVGKKLLETVKEDVKLHLEDWFERQEGCSCRDPTKEEYEKGVLKKCMDDAKCETRQTHYFCPPSCGSICGNQPFRDPLYYFPSVKVDIANGEGLGLIATAYIEKGAYICSYSGNYVRRGRNQIESDYLMELLENMTIYVDAKLSGNIGRFINAGCDANVEFKRVFVDEGVVIMCVAKKRILPSEQLRASYPLPTHVVCRCGSFKCTSVIPPKIAKTVEAEPLKVLIDSWNSRHSGRNKQIEYEFKEKDASFDKITLQEVTTNNFKQTPCHSIQHLRNRELSRPESNIGPVPTITSADLQEDCIRNDKISRTGGPDATQNEKYDKIFHNLNKRSDSITKSYFFRKSMRKRLKIGERPRNEKLERLEKQQQQHELNTTNSTVNTDVNTDESYKNCELLASETILNNDVSDSEDDEDDFYYFRPKQRTTSGKQLINKKRKLDVCINIKNKESNENDNYGKTITQKWSVLQAPQQLESEIKNKDMKVITHPETSANNRQLLSESIPSASSIVSTSMCKMITYHDQSILLVPFTPNKNDSLTDSTGINQAVTHHEVENPGPSASLTSDNTES